MIRKNIIPRNLLILFSIGIVLLGIWETRITQVFAFSPFFQQEVERFLYPPYPGLVGENSVFDHEFPDYSENGSMVTWDGDRDTRWDYDGHPGIDFDTEFVPIFAAAYSNRVDYAGWKNPADHRGENLGLYIQLFHPENSYKTIYGHLNAIAVRTCATECTDIAHGAVIGISGNTGNSSGPHLHFEVLDPNNHRVDPYGWSGTSSSDVPQDPWTYNQPNSLWEVEPDISEVENENTTVLPLGEGNALPFPDGPTGGTVVDDNANGVSPNFSTNPQSGCWSSSDPKPAAWAENGRNLYHNETILANPDNPPAPSCTAKWQLPLVPPSGNYAIYVRVPRPTEITSSNTPIDGAVYRIHAGESTSGDIIINQYQISEYVLMADGASDDVTLESGWVYIGNYYFEQGEENYVELTNLQYGPSLYREVISLDPYEERWLEAESPIIMADAVKFVLTNPRNIDTVLIIDSSGSMQWNDPLNKRLAASRGFVWTASQPGISVVAPSSCVS